MNKSLSGTGRYRKVIVRHRVRRVIFILVLAAGGALAWGYWTNLVASGTKQPIEFPHKTHIDLGFTCTTCHERAEKGAVAGRPPTALCLGCHMGGDTQSAEIKKLRSFGERGQDVPWQRVWRLPPHVFFPHRAHVVVAKIACQTCHGPMETLTKPPATPLKTLAMNDCISCHESREKTVAAKEVTAQQHAIAGRSLLTDCNTCHR
jgi:Cytochrome c7 and related cytochrome c/Class III cytochrome C family